MKDMDKFYALSAPIRREILALLSTGEPLTATVIADKFNVSPSAISQHLKVLLNSQLVSMNKQAQQRIYELNPLAMLEVEAWTKQMLKHFDKITKFTDKTDPETI